MKRLPAIDWTAIDLDVRKPDQCGTVVSVRPSPIGWICTLSTGYEVDAWACDWPQGAPVAGTTENELLAAMVGGAK